MSFDVKRFYSPQITERSTKLSVISFQFLDIDVQCRERGLSDYVELRGGDGLDPAAMEAAGNFCGMESMPGKHE